MPTTNTTHQTRSGRLRRGLSFVTAALVAVGALTACQPQPAPVQPAKGAATLYGDSFVQNAADSFRFFYPGGHKGQQLRVQAFGGLALCDYEPEILKDLAKPAAQRPRMIVLSFAGNAITKCMGAPNRDFIVTNPPGSQKFHQLYDASLARIKSKADKVKVPVIWVKSPPRLASDPHANANVILVDIAKNRGVRVIDATASVSDAKGQWVAAMPCLPWETAADGCKNSMIAVRSWDKLHLSDPAKNGYSSGNFRWVTATVAKLP